MKSMFVLFFSCIAMLGAHVYEISSVLEMNKYKNDEGVLFLYDIDDTLVHLNQKVGTDQWFLHRYSELKKDMDSQKALDVALSEWTGIQSISGLYEVESGTSEMIGQQQEEGVILIGFTTRDYTLSRCTKLQLNSVGIDLSKTAPVKEETHFMNGNGIIFKDGVLFTAGTDKGVTLFKFLELIDFHPKKIVFINDKRQNIGEVEVACEQRNIPFVGLRYNYLDDEVRAYDHELATKQFNYLMNIPSDEEVAACSQ